MQALFFIYFFPESAYTESIRLSIYPQELRDRKEDGYERLRPQAQFGAQPPQAALSAEITQEGCLKVNCRAAARECGLGHSFLIISFLNISCSENLRQLGEMFFRQAEYAEKGAICHEPASYGF